MLRTVRDFVLAEDEGRVHTQRFFKNPGTLGDGRWIDWSFASGQPAYNARLGTSLAFTPSVASGNDAIYFPGIPAGMERRLVELDIFTVATATGQANVEFAAYDLVGYYSQIDGDSTDAQPMDNTLPLPRYADGAGVFPVLVNQVAPATAVADMLVTYTSSAGVQKTVTWRCNLNGAGTVAYTTEGAGTSGPLYAALADGDSGVRTIDEIQFLTAPGGLWAIYMCKPVAKFANRGGSFAALTIATAERNFLMQNGYKAPLIADGAWLGFFYLTNGSNRAITLHGNAKFAWG